MLNSINWSLVKFDVLCIETDPPNRPPEYGKRLAMFMLSKGYKDYAGQVGRNMCKRRALFVLLLCLRLVVFMQLGEMQGCFVECIFVRLWKRV